MKQIMLTHPLEHPAAHPGTFHWWGAISACFTSSQGKDTRFTALYKTNHKEPSENNAHNEHNINNVDNKNQ